jgi:guanylate kinase
MTSLKTLIDHYEPSEQTIALVQATKITLLVGISGAGKDTIKKELLKKPDFRDIVSHTSRLPRANNHVLEVPDIDYHFINDETAEAMLVDHSFVEAKFVHGTVYGTSASELQLACNEHKIAITDIDVQGVAEYKALSQDVVAIFILPPDYTTWRQRLSQRYESHEAFEAEWVKRRDSAIAELTHALEVPYYHFIVNQNIDHTVEVANEIAHKPDLFHRKDDEARLNARDLLEAIRQHAERPADTSV